MALKVSGGGGGGGAEPTISTARVVEVRDRYDIDSAKPLPELDSQPAVAYSAVHKRDGKRSIYALVCDPKLPPRHDIVANLRRIDNRALIRTLDWDVIDWPPEGRRCPVVIMERPGGPRVAENLDQNFAPLAEDAISRAFIEPMAQVMGEMHNLGIFHRMIRPDNLFWSGADRKDLQLGDCVSSPAGMTNPVVFEPLDSAMATAAGRGEGGAPADLFGFGVTILALLTGHCPLQGKTDEDVIQLRLQQGTYGAYVQHHRVSLTLMEPLRGLLNDDPAERWTLDDLSLWLNGRRLSPKQQAMPSKGSRSLGVGGSEYWTAREIAYAMHNNWDQAAILITSGTLDTWLRRSLSEDDMVEAVNLAKAGASDNQDKLIARVLIAMDPHAPIRLKAFSATLEGCSTLLGMFANDRDARTLFASVLSMGLVAFWVEQQRTLEPNTMRQVTRMERVKNVIMQTGLGFGIERVIYELNNNLPCQSEQFERDYVATIEHVLPALDRLCYGDNLPQKFIDRHLAAFIGTHFKRAVGSELRDIERAGDDIEGRIAQARILNMLQEGLHRNVTFPGLTNALAVSLDPATKRFYSRGRRNKIRTRIRKAAKPGKIKDLLDIVEDSAELSQDNQSFERAVREHRGLTYELIGVMSDIHNKKRLSEEYGGQLAYAAALLGCVAAVALSGFFRFF